MKYSPHKDRRSVRLAGYDYAAPGVYFVTICTHQRQMFFDQPEMRELAEACWRAIPDHAAQVVLDEWVVMPNHVHGLVVITERAEAGGAGVDALEERSTQALSASTINALGNIDDRGRGVQLNAPTVNSLDDRTTQTLHTSTMTAAGDVDDRGRGVQSQRDASQLNAPTVNSTDDPAMDSLDDRTANTLNASMTSIAGNIGDRGRGVQSQRDASQLNVPTMNALDDPTANALDSAMNTTNDLAYPRNADNPFSRMSPRRNTLSVIVRTYKAAVTTACHAGGQPEFAWQRGFYEHIVRGPRQLDAIRRYIRDNPLQWALDRDNPANMRRLAPPLRVADYLADLPTL